jgi:hypothetical protein
MMTEKTFNSAAELNEHLKLLYAERKLAEETGLAENGMYMAELSEDIALSRAAFVGTAVTEIATLRGELSGRNQG